VGDTDGQFQPFDRAGTGHDRDFLIADFDAVHVNDRVLFLELPADQLPGSQNRQDTFDPGQCGQRLIVQDTIVPDHPDNGPLLAGRNMRLQSQLAQPVDNVIDFPLRRVRLQDNNHDLVSLSLSSGARHVRKRAQEQLIFFRKADGSPAAFGRRCGGR
jgi:hypothetical protein